MLGLWRPLRKNAHAVCPSLNQWMQRWSNAVVTTTIPVRFDCSSTALRPFDNLPYDRRPTCCGLLYWFLVHPASKTQLGDTIPPAPPVLRSLFNLVPADAHFPFSFVTLSFQEIPRILRCHLWCAASSFFICVTENGHSSALLSNVAVA